MQQSINLLFPATTAVRKVKKGPNLMVVTVNIILLLTFTALYGYLHYQEIGLTAKIAEAKSEVEELSKPLPGEVARRPYVKEKNEMQTAIKEITDTRKFMSKPLDEIAAITDPEIAIKSIGIRSKPGYIVVTGIAPSKADVVRFMGNIQQTKNFSNAYIKSTAIDFTDFFLSYKFVIEITPNEGVFKK